MKITDLHGTDIVYGSLMEIESRLGFINDFNDSQEFKSFVTHSENKHTLMDIGCSYGAFGLYFAKKATWKESYCFDGSFNAWLALNQTIQLNNLTNIKCHRMLIGEQDGLVGVAYDQHQSLINKNSSMMELMMQVDSLCQLWNIEPDCMKIDTEGYEFKVLSGARDVLETYRPTLFMEVHPNFLRYHNNTIYDVAKIYDQLEYQALDLFGNEIVDYKKELEEETTDSHRTVWVPR